MQKKWIWMRRSQSCHVYSSASKKTNHLVWSKQLDSFSYCMQTFPMSEAVKDVLLTSRMDLEFPVATFEETDQRRRSSCRWRSCQPSIASLGAMALAGRRKPALNYALVDDKDLVKSRSVDGLLEFINEPRGAVSFDGSTAANEQVKRNSIKRWHS